MRLFVWREADGRRRVGLLEGETVRPLSDPAGAVWAIDEKAASPDDPPLAASALRPAPAVIPPKTVCIGLNYRDHLEEQHLPMPDRPTIFGKWPNAVIGDGDAIVRPEGSEALDAEVELGVVIGRRAWRVRREEAMAHVAGYVIVNDVTARDWQGNKGALHPGARGDGQWLRAKGSDTFLPIGPVFVTAEEIPDPTDLRLRSWWTRGSGPEAGRETLMQDGTSADMLFDIPAAIEFVSRAITLEPGDLLSTGTPSGVGVFRDPPLFLEPGDRVRCEVEGIGSVENPIVDWPDDPRNAARGATLGA